MTVCRRCYNGEEGMGGDHDGGLHVAACHDHDDVKDSAGEEEREDFEFN